MLFACIFFRADYEFWITIWYTLLLGRLFLPLLVCSSMFRIEASWASLVHLNVSVIVLVQLVFRKSFWWGLIGVASDISNTHNLTANSLKFWLLQSFCFLLHNNLRALGIFLALSIWTAFFKLLVESVLILWNAVKYIAHYKIKGFCHWICSISYEI